MEGMEETRKRAAFGTSFPAGQCHNSLRDDGGVMEGMVLGKCKYKPCKETIAHKYKSAGIGFGRLFNISYLLAYEQFTKKSVWV